MTAVPDPGAAGEDLLAGAEPVRADRGPDRRSVMTALSGLTGLVAAVGGEQWWRSRHVREPVHGLGLALDPDGGRVLLDGGSGHRLVPGSRVLDVAGRRSQVEEAVRDERAWLASGRVPGAGTRWEPMARAALLDLRTLLLPDGALVAGWAGLWRYVWPRDAAFGVAALAGCGHLGDAAAVLGFLARAQAPSGLFQARYRPDGAGPPDRRGVQLDGSGWALWAAGQLARRTSTDQLLPTLVPLRPLLDRSVDAITTSLDPRTGLPPAGPDYWEVPEHRLTLGTAAPLLAGLEAAVALYGLAGEPAAGDQVATTADRLRAGIRTAFAPGFGRYPGGSDGDAAVTFLLAPVGSTPDPGLAGRLPDLARRSRRPGGGLAPGSGWRQDGVSWTPETALFALAFAANGDRPLAERMLDWLDRHRTRYGALPEKVCYDGSPAGPAPLAWTAAVVLLAVDLLDAAD
jgi:glucoamylase